MGCLLSLFLTLGADVSAPPRLHRDGGGADAAMCLAINTAAPSAGTRALRALGRQIGAPGAAIELPCDDTRSACVRVGHQPELETFFAALDNSSRKHTRIVVFGNSLIASDGIVSLLRDGLSAHFGDGGRGLLLADRMASYGPRDRTAVVARGWRAETCADGEPETAPLGMAGVQHISDGPAFARFNVDGERSAEVFWLDNPGTAQLEWRVDQGEWALLTTSAEGPSGITRVALPRASDRFELRARGAGAVVQGVALERAGGGIVVDTFGVPSADATRWLQTDERIFAQQLAARNPALAVIMLGGNEIKRYGGPRSAPRVESDLRELILRSRAAASSSCLVVGPIDAVRPTDGDAFTMRPGLTEVIAIERRVALEEGCAFFDLLGAMGGPGSLERLHAAGALHDDYVHPKKAGLDLLGQLLVDALLRAYATSSPLPPDRHTAQTR